MSKKRDRVRKVSPKFVEQRQERVPPLHPKTQGQAEYIQAIDDNKVIVASGYAGTGKTKIAGHKAGEWLRTGRIQRIIVARPYVQMGKSAGLRPGTTEEKLFPYVRSILESIRYACGTAYDYHMRKGEIEIQALEDIRGRSFDENCVLIIDEAQNATPEEIRAIVTRLGRGAKLILCGDPHQKDIPGMSGIIYLQSLIERHNISNTAWIEFDVDDIVRSDIVKEFVLAFIADDVNY